MRGLESDPLPSPKQDASSDQTWCGRKRRLRRGLRRRWTPPGWPRRPAAAAVGRTEHSQLRRSGRTARGPRRKIVTQDAAAARIALRPADALGTGDAGEAGGAGATARGLPPTPSNEAIARVFGEYGEARTETTRTPGPPRPSPGKGPSLNCCARPPSTQRLASAAPRARALPRARASVTAGPRAQRSRNTEHGRAMRRGRSAARQTRGRRAGERSQPSDDKDEALREGGGARGSRARLRRRRGILHILHEAADHRDHRSSRPAWSRPAGHGARGDDASPVPVRLGCRSGSAAAFRKQTEAKGIKPVPATATRTAKLRPRRARGGGVRAGGHRRRAHAARRGGFRGGAGARAAHRGHHQPGGLGRWRRCARLPGARRR